MQKFILLISMLLMAFSLFSQQKNGRKFEMFQPKFQVVDDTQFEMKKVKQGTSVQTVTVINNALSYSDNDIKVRIETVDSDVKLKCQEILENGVVVDTIVLAAQQIESTKWNGSKPVYRYAFVNLKPTQRLHDYVQKDYQIAIKNVNTIYQRYLEKLHSDQQKETDVIESAKRKAERDSINLAESKKRAEQSRIDEEERQQQQQASLQRRILNDLHTDFTEPTSPIQTKSGTNAGGAKFTYEYYVGKDGYEVKHGKYTVSMTYNNHKYWTGLSNLGWVYLNGTESITCYYQNGILHGKLTYTRNVSTTSTFGNAMNLKQTYDLQIYKGFLTGSFTFTYEGITYTGKAVNGIIEYCDYQTSGGYHGKLSSITNNPPYLSIPKVSNGSYETEITLINLQSLVVQIPMFRFPLIGSND